MVTYLTLEDLLRLADAAIGGQALIRDYGLLESALARPSASVFGLEAYPDMHVKAAAPLHSLCTNHALVDGNKRLAFAAAAVFLELNGHVVEQYEDMQFETVMAVAAGELSDLEKIAERLRYWSRRG